MSYQSEDRADSRSLMTVMLVLGGIAVLAAIFYFAMYAPSRATNDTVIIRESTPGPAGAPGAPGATGAQGTQGYQGTQGDQGQQGTQGNQGQQGDQGDQGMGGTTGSTGP